MHLQRNHQPTRPLVSTYVQRCALHGVYEMEHGDMFIIRSGRIQGSAPRDVSLMSANDPRPTVRKDASKKRMPIIINVDTNVEVEKCYMEMKISM